MPEVTAIEKNNHIRHVFTVEPGERVKICRCYASKEFPFCDGSHAQLPNNIGPAIVEVTNPQNPPDPTQPEK